MANPIFVPVTGVIQEIAPFQNQCCNQLITLRTSDNVVNFILNADTYVVDNMQLRPGMRVTAFYDENLPVPLVYPPRYQAALIARTGANENVMADFFDRNLNAVNHSLKLNPSSSTQVITANGQRFSCRPGGHYLIVFYGATTRSLPPQTTPRKIIVLC